jgi:hypothetical protein
MNTARGKEGSILKGYSIAALVTCLLAISVIPEGVHALQGTFGMGGGLAGLTGDGNGYWNLGFTAGGHALFRITPRVMAGGRISYCRWGPDEKTFVGELGYPGIAWEVNGSRTAVEIAPVVRFLASARDASRFQLFAQIGAGLYILNSETTITASYAGGTETFADEGTSENKIGMSVGVGIGISYFEILPLFTIVATEGASAGYYAIHAGAAFTF